MTRSFPRSVSAIVLSLVLTITTFGASTVPARADGEDAARVLGGLLALYAISRVIDTRNDDRRQVTRHQPHLPREVAPHRPSRLVAPEQCRREFRTAQGQFRGYGFRCMQRNVTQANHLPSECLVQFETDRGLRSYYRGRCLHRNGWVRG